MTPERTDRQRRQRGPQIGSLVAGMVAGADSITDMALLRHGRWERLHRPYAPSTPGRSFAIHLRARPPTRRRRVPVSGGLAERTPVVAGIDGTVLVDIDDSIIEVHGHGNKVPDTATPGARVERVDHTVTTERARR